MLSKLLSSQTIIYHLILFFSFSLSVNYFVDLEFINFFSYVFFHLTLIYVVFYFFHFSLIFISFLYGIFFDIFFYKRSICRYRTIYFNVFLSHSLNNMFNYIFIFITKQTIFARMRI